MADLVKMSLDGGGSILVRLGPGEHRPEEQPPPGGPVRAGRIEDRMHEVVVMASRPLREALTPITVMSRQVLDQLAQAQPQHVQVEFGIELTAEAGAVLAKAETGCHLTVTLTWGMASEPAVTTPVATHG